MSASYDKYYQTQDLFGDPYPELIEFFAAYPKKGKVLDLGCGQGRDAIALARIGYSVIGIDQSKVGIDQMNRIAQSENLNLIGKVGDIYSFNQFVGFDIILLDSMFHFTKKDKGKEIELIKKITSLMKNGSLIVVCIQDTGNKVLSLNEAIDFEKQLTRLMDMKFSYSFEDKKSGHKSKTDYRMIAAEK
ncbi:class I SAM-dependent methyltransferase [Algoriphagus kandeliae]|uniref:Class I SAM-dependent methyltransferase n=1 Tax=Algoriphagus kandeliae TaxID=2562278 RepID=A0A4Y9QLG0_9BACT|nr:class I SAM-dependent methyltransferase [Algoriphagus kandeliae]TFV92412.1 class I SAM-dependent methyltransferase [Algoriphagus kandeliae]